MKRRSFLTGMATVPAVPLTAAHTNVTCPEPFLGRFIHEAGDGLPPRKVYVDGKEIEYAFYVDLKEGVVRYHPVDGNGRWLRRSAGHELLKGEVRGTVLVTLAD